MEDFNMRMLVPGIVGIVLFFCGIAFSKLGVMSIEADYNDVSSVYADLQNEYELKRSSQVAADKLITSKYDAIKEVATRHESDDKIASDFMTAVFSWTDYASYNKTKSNIVSTYAPDDVFVSMFFPDADYAKTDVKQTAQSKKSKKKTTEAAKTNKIDDAKMSMKFNGIASYLISEDGTEYTYLAHVTVISTANDKSSTVVLTIQYTIDGQGVISNIKGVL